ncbi:hypothetical protein [Halostella litorea]|uniref:hypothetical protein n=1 Tax=Halostella litorea TaxID=2528831 RepID=UPI001092ABBB|nr:hypothetical protein [Halostella litorea]
MNETERLKERIGTPVEKLGETRLEALIAEFGSADEVPISEIDELQRADKIGPLTAGRIWEAQLSVSADGASESADTDGGEA